MISMCEKATVKPVGLCSDCVLIKRKSSERSVMDRASTSASACQGPDKIMEKRKSVRPEDREECSEMPSSRHDMAAAHSTHSSSGDHT